VPTELAGPFLWVAVKTKYFVTALFSVDSTASGGAGRLAGVRAIPTDTRRRPAEADIRVGLPLAAAGGFRYSLYAGPLEYPRLRAIGHDFYDVNPYGWPGFRTIIRPVAVGARWLLVRMRELGITYGWALVLFGIMVRVALWPLNQKAMRSSMALQAVQPLMKDIQERYKNDPQRLQQEMFKLYKEHKVNPFGGCWPMLLPMPILFALFFVFQNSIELRGAPWLWLTDLSRPDPFYIIPVLMGVSMYAVTKIGQVGMEPNPQMKMMLYIMPVMMTVLFLNFASGLNLYYAVQNIASIPQQWMIAKERQKRNPATRK
jgi:YidC/Oxa1 family membrane protein insertase